MMKYKPRNEQRLFNTVKANVPKAAPAATPKDNIAQIVFPMENETIKSSSYTLKIKTKQPCKKVEVRFDGGEWEPCREAIGFWWFDWANYARKTYSVETRALGADGVEHISVRQQLIAVAG